MVYISNVLKLYQIWSKKFGNIQIKPPATEQQNIARHCQREKLQKQYTPSMRKSTASEGRKLEDI